MDSSTDSSTAAPSSDAAQVDYTMGRWKWRVLRALEALGGLASFTDVAAYIDAHSPWPDCEPTTVEDVSDTVESLARRGLLNWAPRFQLTDRGRDALASDAAPTAADLAELPATITRQQIEPAATSI